MKRVIGAVFCTAVATVCGSVQAADIQFDLRGDRGSAGYLDGAFYGMSDAGFSQPTSIVFTVYPYFNQFTPFTETISGASANMTGGLDIENGVVAASQFSFSIPDTNLTLDTGAQTFSGDFLGNIISFDQQNEVTEGGGMSFNVTPSAAPEPATWTLTIAGVGMAGAALRRRRTAAA